MRTHVIMISVIAWAGLFITPAAWSQDNSLPQPLEQRIAILEKKLEIYEEKASKNAKDSAFTSFGKDGFSLTSTDHSSRLKFGGYVQADYRAFHADQGAFNDQFVIRRARFIVDASLGQFVDIRLQQEFAGPSSNNQDAYVELKYVPSAKLKIGKQTPAIGLERLQSSADLLLPELGLTVNLVPNRDAGAQFSGDILNGILVYHAGVFNGNVDNTTNETETNSDKDYVGRIFAHPFKNSKVAPLKMLGLGFSGSSGDQSGSATSSQLNSGFKTDGQNIFFSYKNGAYANGKRTRLSPQGYCYAGPLSIFGEYVTSSEDVQKSSSTNLTHSFTNIAWQINISYVLTGEKTSFKGVKPRHNFDPKNKGWGAFELIGRVADLKVDPDIFSADYQSTSYYAKRARAWTGGLNWYLNNNTKFSSAYTTTSFLGGSGGATINNVDRKPERVWITRLQASF